MVMAKTDKPTTKLPPRPLPMPPEHDHTRCHPIEKKDDFAKKDKNDDGKLNADEFSEGRGLLDKALDPDKFDRYDTDNDGYVTRNEDAMGKLRDAFKKSSVGLPDFKPKPPPMPTPTPLFDGSADPGA